MSNLRPLTARRSEVRLHWFSTAALATLSRCATSSWPGPSPSPERGLAGLLIARVTLACRAQFRTASLAGEATGRTAGCASAAGAPAERGRSGLLGPCASHVKNRPLPTGIWWMPDALADFRSVPVPPLWK